MSKIHYSTLIFLLLLLVRVQPALAQQIDLHGQISIHNSRYETGKIEYVQDAFVQAPFAGSTNSDSEGLFLLTFQGIKRGAPIRLSVEKTGLEIVNQGDIDSVILGRLLPLQIYLAPEGKLAQAQVDLFEISESALLQRHNDQIALLQASTAKSDSLIQELEQKLNREIADAKEAEELLNRQLFEIQRRLPSIAKELAQVNLDFVSDMYLEAYEYLKMGEVELAITALDEAVLNAEAKQSKERLDLYQLALDSLDSARTLNLAALDKVVLSQVLNARRFAQSGAFVFAAEEFEKAVRNLSEVAFRGEYTELKHHYEAALLAMANQEDQVACALFEEALKESMLEVSPNPVIYNLDPLVLNHYLQFIQSLRKD